MDFIETYRQISIEMNSTNTVTRLINVGSICELYSMVVGDVTLVKRRLDEMDTKWLSEYDGSAEIFVGNPQEYSEIGKLKEICNYPNVGPVTVKDAKFTDLNFLHFGETLIIFGDDLHKNDLPNAIVLCPVSRKDIVISVKKPEDEFEEEAEEPVSGNDDTADNEESAPEDFHCLEMRLLREEIIKRLNETFYVVDVSVPGVYIERKTIPLTDYYKKNNIAGRQLTGSWHVFSKEDLSKAMDTRILKDAQERLNRQYIIHVEQGVKIIRKSLYKEYREKVESICKSYGEYLAGKRLDTIGGIKISCECDLKDLIRESKNRLRSYLMDLQKSVGKELKPQVDKYIERQMDVFENKLSDVQPKLHTYAFTDEYISHPENINKLYETVIQSPQLFDDDLCELIEKYLMNLPEH